MHHLLSFSKYFSTTNQKGLFFNLSISNIQYLIKWKKYISMNLFNKTILITGGSEGLGLELAKQLLAEKAEVIICSRSKDKLDYAARLLNSNKLRTFACDVSNSQEVELLVKNIDKLDILINNAGLYVEGNLEKNTPADISNVIDVNLKGLIYTTKSSLRLLKKQNSSFIVNVISTKGVEPAENLAVYCATKYGVRGFSESLRLELKSTNIKVFDFFPASMDTDFHKKTGVIKDKTNWMSTKDAAEVVVFALKREAPLTFDHLVIRNQ